MPSAAPTTISPASFKSDATIISLVGIAHGTSHFFHLMLPSLFPWFMPEFGLGYAQVGVLMTVFFVVSGIGQALAGIWVDKFGAHRVLCAGVGMLACSGLVVSIAPNFVALMAAAAVAGIGNSVFHPADFALLAKRVSQQRMGHAFSTHGISGNLGWAIAPLFMTAIASAAGWRAAGIGAALFGAVSLTLLIWKRDLLKYQLQHEIRADPVENPAVTVTRSTWSFLREPMLWFAFLFFLFSTFGFGALQNFAPPLLRELFGLSLAASTSALSIYLLGGSAGLVLGGFLAKPGNQHERYVMFAFASGVFFALALALLPMPVWLVLPTMALMGFGVGIAGPSRDLLVRAATKARLGEGAYGRVYGMVYSGLDVGLALAPIAFGTLLDRQLYSMVFIGVAMTLASAIVAALALGREVHEI
ncbi:MAG: MFS transporter [Betaproteobacteria bacterium]|nr:MFS transporter [Betaproteobacteria bacterium]